MKELSQGYRTARRNTTLICALSLAWAAAQFDLVKTSIGPLQEIDISQTSIPLVLGILSLFCFIRMNIEYMMQSTDVRKWKLARVDYILTYELAYLAILAVVMSTELRGEPIITLCAAMFVNINIAIYFYFVRLNEWLKYKSEREVNTIFSSAISYKFIIMISIFLTSGILSINFALSFVEPKDPGKFLFAILFLYFMIIFTICMPFIIERVLIIEPKIKFVPRDNSKLFRKYTIKAVD